MALLHRALDEKQCQRISGRDLDRAIGELFLATVSPLNLGMALAIERELEARMEEVDRLRRQVVQRAQQEADLLGAATCRSTPTIVWWPINWRRTGIANYVNCIQRKKNTNVKKRTSKGCSAQNSARRSAPWLRIFPESGTIRTFPHRERKRMHASRWRM